jgi:GNAT superfamily N-acetyltransferase
MARPDDAEGIQHLLRELGYPADLALIEERLQSVLKSEGDAVLVAEMSGKPAGLASLHVFDLFHERGRIGRITSFVVDGSARRQGIGRLLLAAVDDCFLTAGCMRAEVTSGDHRVGAHAFYEAHGYVRDERRFLKRY